MKIIQGNFKVKMTREQYEEEAIPHAKRMSDTPGLIWKIWAFDDTQNEVLGIYFFRDDAIAQMVYDNMNPKTLGENCYDVKFRIWDIQEELCKICNVPL